MTRAADGCGSEWECTRLEKEASDRRDSYCRPDAMADACKVADSDLQRVRAFVEKMPWRVSQRERASQGRTQQMDPTAASVEALPRRDVSTPSAADALEASCAADRAERVIVRARKAEADAAAAAERAKKPEEARARADYIKKNCRTLMKPSGPPQACVDDDGYYRDCSAAPEVYLQCPATGPKGLRGIVGRAPITIATGDPSRIARVVKDFRGCRPGTICQPAEEAHEPTKDERCADLDRAAAQDALVKRVQDASRPADATAP